MPINSILLYQSNYSYRIGNPLLSILDTINFKLSAEKAGNCDLFTTIPNYLSNVLVTTFEDGNTAIKGNLKNLSVTVSTTGLTIKNGSLTKWHKGNNLEMLNRGETKEAIENLSDVLHLPIHKATVSRFDFGINFPTKHNLALYLPYLGNNGRYTRLEQKNGLNYKITGRELCLYDKIIEMKFKHDFIPPNFVGNYGRFEKRYLSNIATYFKCQEVIVENLYNELFFAEVLNDVFNDYQKINKQNTSKIDLSMVKNKRELYKMGVVALIEKQGGENAALNNISERQKLGQLTKEQARRLRIEIKNCSHNQLISKESELMKELDKNVFDAVGLLG